MLKPVHPGEVLREEFLNPLDLTQSDLAEVTGLPLAYVNQICSEETPITHDVALRLGTFFGTSMTFWVNLQNRYDLESGV